jgi:putative FmdB family regulatory protein
MPNYEFKCVNCGHKTEVLRKHTDESVVICPKCGKEMTKQFSALNVFQIKIGPR